MLPHSSLYRISLRFILPAAAFLFSAIAGISVAAWIDAPNSPPNYGVSPLAQEDFRPMNLGTTAQTKNGSMAIVGTLIATSTTPTSFPNFPGSVIASSFQDSENTAYGVDPASASYAGIFGGLIGIRQQNPVASLVVNNYYDPFDLTHAKETPGKVGSSGDALYAYSSSTAAAVSAEQGNASGYALYSSGGINYFGGNVGIGTNTPSGLLHVSTKNYQRQSTGNLGHNTPRCACDTNNDIQECPASFATTDALGSICHDQYKQTILFFDVNYSSQFQVVESGLVVKESGSVGVSGSLCLNNDCKTAWPVGIGVVDFISCSVAEYIPSCSVTCPGGKIIAAFGVLTQGPDCTGSPSIADGGTILSVTRTNNCNNTSTTFGASCAIGATSGYAPGMQTYDAPGTYSFVVPASVYSISVELWGGGGGSGYGIFSLNYDNSDFGRNTGGAGASGGYAKKLAIPVNPGDTFTAVVGAGGVGAVRPVTKITPTTKGDTGGTSSFAGPGASLSASGGEGAVGFDTRYTSGTYNGVTACIGANLPIGGTAAGGTTNISGLNGATCVGGADSPIYPDIPGAMPPVTVDHNNNPLLLLFGQGGVGHHYPVNPYTSNPEVNANSGKNGGVIVWW